MALNGVSIDLDRTRTLRYDVNGLAELEERFGDRPIHTVLSQERLGLKAIRLLLWIGLRHEDRRLTLDGAGGLLQRAMEQDRLPAVIEAVMDALRHAGVLRKDEETGAGNAPGPEAAPVARGDSVTG